MEFKGRFYKPCPADQANPISALFFCWILPLFRRGYSNDLSYDNLWKIRCKDESRINAEKLRRQWQRELKKRKPSLPRAIFRAFGGKYIKYVLFIGGYEELIIKVIQPYFLGVILDFFAGFLKDPMWGYLCMAGFGFCSVSFTITHHPYIIHNARQGMRVRVAVMELVMEKLFLISRASEYSGNIGHLVTLMSNDVSKFDEFAFYMGTLILAPLQTALISYLLWRTLGYAYLTGFSLILIFVPIQAFMGRRYGTLRRKVLEFTSQRVSLMGEIINGMKTIKTYAWEKAFIEKITALRSQEMGKIKTACTLKAINLTLSFVTTRIFLFVCLLAYLHGGDQLTAKTVFVTLALFNTLRVTLTTHFPNAVSVLSEVRITCKRVQAFLTEEEVWCLPSLKEKPSDSKGFVEVENLRAYWDTSSISICLENITFSLSAGDLLIVVGPVGSGKTSLLLAILREIPVKAEKLLVSGRISYSSQEGWTYNSTIQENIVFGRHYDSARYLKTLNVTCLDKDVDSLAAGDNTMVGERGISLSGGQRSRVALARAVYQDAEVYLLDDPLAAVDSKVANHVFQKCFKEYLRHKIVILVTHHLHFLRRASRIMVLNGGRGRFFSSYEQLLNSEQDMAIIATVEKQKEMIKPFKKEVHKIRTKSGSIVVSPIVSSLSASSGRSLSVEIERPREEEEPIIEIEDEKVPRRKTVSFGAYIKYFNAGSNWVFCFLVIFLNLTSQVFFHANDLWLGEWTNKIKSTRNISNVLFIKTEVALTDQWSGKTFQNIQAYFTLVTLLFVTTLFRAVLYLRICNWSSIKLHDSIFERIMRAPMEVFEEQPVGRIMNRFTLDLNVVDEMLPFTSFDQLINLLTVIGVISVVTYVLWYMIFPAILLLVSSYFVRSLYVRTGRSLRGLEAKARGPLFSHISTTMDGLTTIRAFRMEASYRNSFSNYLDDAISCKYLSLVAARLLGVWSDWNCIVYICAITGLLTFFSTNIPPGYAGLTLSQILLLTGMFQWTIRQSAEMESQLTSLEKVAEFKELPVEPERFTDIRPPPEWPSAGEIEFSDVVVQYPSASKPALNKVSVKIMSREKIGIVGRTGSGKTTFIFCLFRLCEHSGKIRIDGIDIQDIGVEDLRSRISVIPQEPVIFSGTLRFNLDPFKVHSDEEIWEALEQVQLTDKMGAVGLDFMIREGGENFSLGQRQLIALARILLHKNKILVIDEGSASIDYKTDELVQKIIKTKFADCTILTNAHRLETIIECDRVLVMEHGRIVEFDAPYNLLKSNTIFRKLVSQTGKYMTEKLRFLAKKHYEKNHPEVQIK